jgi:hypothetical protein
LLLLLLLFLVADLGLVGDVSYGRVNCACDKSQRVIKRGEEGGGERDANQGCQERKNRKNDCWWVLVPAAGWLAETSWPARPEHGNRLLCMEIAIPRN